MCVLQACTRMCMLLFFTARTEICTLSKSNVDIRFADHQCTRIRHFDNVKSNIRYSIFRHHTRHSIFDISIVRRPSDFRLDTYIHRQSRRLRIALRCIQLHTNYTTKLLGRLSIRQPLSHWHRIRNTIPKTSLHHRKD